MPKEIPVYYFDGRWKWSRKHCLMPLPGNIKTRAEAKEAAGRLLEVEAEKELREMCV